MKYKAIEIKEGNSTEPVQYVGVYTLNWLKEWGIPEVGFVEIEESVEITEGRIEEIAKETLPDLEGQSDKDGAERGMARKFIKDGIRTAIKELNK